jgi:mannose-6-phosphate isomerase-like protein (cupin superfamily)
MKRNMAITKWNDEESYAGQTGIVKQALESPDHSLNSLLAMMRSSGQAAVYFSGTRLDHDHCFGSEDAGLLLSVLPEDGEKAAKPGYHPGSTEVYVTFQGSLIVEYLENRKVNEIEVGPAPALILPPGQCHRVRQNGHQAASVIIKTNLKHRPGVVRCNACEYFSDPEECALYQRWISEKPAAAT